MNDRIQAVESESDSDNYSDHPSTYEVVRDRSSEVSMVKLLAAESIQEAYHRFRACKTDVKMRRINSCEKLVTNLAADTIKSGLRR